MELLWNYHITEMASATLKSNANSKVEAVRFEKVIRWTRSERHRCHGLRSQLGCGNLEGPVIWRWKSYLGISSFKSLKLSHLWYFMVDFGSGEGLRAWAIHLPSRFPRGPHLPKVPQLWPWSARNSSIQRPSISACKSSARKGSQTVN